MPVIVKGRELRDNTGTRLGMTLEQPLGDGDWKLYVRPSRFSLGASAAERPNRLDARVSFIEFLGDVYRYHLKAGALEIFADNTGRAGHAVGETVAIGWHSSDMQAYR